MRPLTILLSLLAFAAAHGPEPADVGLYRRENFAARDSLQKRCSGALAGMASRRLARRGISGPSRRQTAPAAVCSMTPEVTEGPYHILNAPARANVTDGQAGVPLTLHVSFLDVATCEPAANVWMEIWAANATGYYSGFTALTNAMGGSGGAPPNATASGSMSGAPTGTVTGTMTSAPQPQGSGSMSSGSAQTSVDPSTLSPTAGADSSTGGGPGAASLTDNLAFLRGAVQADSQGEATMYTIVPGWYTGRAVHIHLRVFNGSSVAANGTFDSASGVAHHTGQIFFQQSLLDQLADLAPYNMNHLAYANATTNLGDSIYPYAEAGGYSPDLETTMLGDTIADGLEGTIVVAINGSWVSPELATAYYTGGAANATNSTTSGASSNSTSGATNAAPRRFSILGLF